MPVAATALHTHTRDSSDMGRGDCITLVQAETHPLYKRLMEAAEGINLIISCVLTGTTEAEPQEHHNQET